MFTAVFTGEVIELKKVQNDEAKPAVVGLIQHDGGLDGFGNGILVYVALEGDVLKRSRAVFYVGQQVRVEANAIIMTLLEEDGAQVMTPTFLLAEVTAI